MVKLSDAFQHIQTANVTLIHSNDWPPASDILSNKSNERESIS